MKAPTLTLPLTSAAAGICYVCFEGGYMAGFFRVLFVLSFLGAASADIVKITSTPSGATVEIDGIKVGTTPYEMKVPGGYIHGTKTVWGKSLEHQMRLHLTLDGYVSKDIDMANGPFPWIGLKGTYYGDYWVLKTKEFHFDLTPSATAFTGQIQVASTAVLTPTRPELTPEKVAELAGPAVLRLERSEA